MQGGVFIEQGKCQQPRVFSIYALMSEYGAKKGAR